MSFPDFIGLVGVAFIVVAYLFSQTGRLNVERPIFPLLNGVGALLILYSLAYSFNLASFVIEVTWLLISIFGLWRSLSRRKNEVKQDN